MAIGTGLPIPQGGYEPVQGPGIASGGDFGASSYARMAQAGEKIEKAGLSVAEMARADAEKKADQLRAGQLSEYENETRRAAADLHAKELNADGGPNPQRALEAGQQFTANQMKTIADPKLQEAVKKNAESAFTGVYTNLTNYNAQRKLSNAHAATDQNIAGITQEYNTALSQGEMYDADGNYTQKGMALASKLDFYTKRAVDNGQHPPEWRQNILNDISGNSAGVQIGRKAYEAAASGKISEDQVQAEIRRNTLENKSLNEAMKGIAYTKANEFFIKAWGARKKDISETRQDASTMRTLYANEGIDAVSANDHAELRDRLTRNNDATGVFHLDLARSKAAAKALLESGGPAALQQGLATQAAQAAGIPEGLVDAVKLSEGFEPTAKWDYKQYSGGYGTVAQRGQTFTKESADTALRVELAKDAGWLNSKFPGLQQANPGAWAALLSLSHNSDHSWADKGLGNLVRQSQQSGDWGPTAQRFLEYNKAGGGYIPGLQNRRNREVQWFFKGAPGGPAQDIAGGESIVSPFPQGEPRGLVTAGNINLYDRPVVDAPGGGKATVRSIVVGFDDKFYVLPTVLETGDEHGGGEARIVSNDEAIAAFKHGGQHLGAFRTKADAERYAKNLHVAQEEFFITGAPPRMTVPEAKGASVQPTIDLSRRAGPTQAIVVTDPETSKNVVIPSTGPDGKQLSSTEALEQYKQSGDHYGIFDKLGDANAFQQELRKTPSLVAKPPPPTTTGGGGGGGGVRVPQGPPVPPGPGGRIPSVPMEAPTQTPPTPPSVGGVPSPPSPDLGNATAQPRFSPIQATRVFEKAAWEAQEKWLKDNWDQLEPAIKSGKMSDVDSGTIFNIADSPHVKDQKFATKVKVAMAAGRLGAAIENMPTEQARAVIDQFEVAMRASNAPPNFVKDVLDDVNQSQQNRMALARTNPQGYALQQGAAAAVPLNFDNYGQMLQAINDRRLTAHRTSMETHQPIGNMLSPEDQQAFAFMITNGNEKQVDIATRALATLTATEATAAMSGDKNPLKPALIGAQMSSEPFRYDGVNSTLQKWKDSDRLRFGSIMTEGSEQMLDAWSVNKSIYTPQQVIELNQQKHTAQYQQAMKEALSGQGFIADDWNKLKSADIANAVDPPGLARHIPFYTTRGTAPPADMGAAYKFGNPFALRLLEAETKQAYFNLRGQGVPHEMALQKAGEIVRNTWGVTATNNQLMKLPPDMTTRREGEKDATVGGSMEWLNQQIDDFVDGHYRQRPLRFLGSEARRAAGQSVDISPLPRAGYFPFPAPPRRYTFSTLVSDEQTQREVAGNPPGVAPSYGVIVTTPDGRKEVVVTPDGNQFRFRPERETAINEYNKSVARVAHESYLQQMETYSQGGVMGGLGGGFPY